MTYCTNLSRKNLTSDKLHLVQYYKYVTSMGR